MTVCYKDQHFGQQSLPELFAQKTEGGKIRIYIRYYHPFVEDCWTAIKNTTD